MSRPLRVLSFGAGVQSSTVLLLALNGEVELDAVVFADTGWEPVAVYAHLWSMAERCALAGLPLIITRGGDIRKVTPMGTGGALDAPFYLTNERGGEGMARRQCTSKLKVAPVRRELRRLMEAAGARRAELVFGISADEVTRMRSSGVGYLEHRYPLVDRGWRRSDCLRYLLAHGVRAPRSACIGCPYRTNAEWRALRDESPAEFADAVAWEREVQAVGLKVPGTPFVHRSRVPLDQVDLSTLEDHGQLTLAGSWEDECEGMCGV